MKILAIETSCDETASAVIGMDRSAGIDKPVILSNVINSQVDLHAKTGGVVPEVASRAHLEAVVPVVAEALIQSRAKNDAIDYQEAIRILDQDITHIAVTAGPGLIGSLLVGFNAAKTISNAKDLPIIPINHIEGHLYSALIGHEEKLAFPVLALTVSGGHTSLTLMEDHGKY
jgi:N6-L-threonylcarbamoyladenine synthase